MSHENCIFCKIVAGELPAAKVYENDHVLAFLDISQVTKGHTLVIPKKHEQNVYELSPESAKHVFQAVPAIANAIKTQFNPIGLNLLNNNGEAAGQTVFHYHIHIIPRYGKEDGFQYGWEKHDDQYTVELLNEIADVIAKEIQ